MHTGIRANELSKSFGETRALQNITFDIAPGELFGFIGPDGAGKTTLFRILATLLSQDSGSATMAGIPTDKQKEIRKIVGYMPGRFSLYHDLTVEENLRFFATIFGTTIEENYNLIRDIYVMLLPFKNRKAGALSGGMKQKLALSCALIHKPKILLLDEPTTGVDPVSRKEFWEMLGRLKGQDITIAVSTPYMDEAILCDRIALMQEGQILEVNDPRKIESEFPEKVFSISGNNKFSMLRTLEGFKHCKQVYPFGEHLHYIDNRKDVAREAIESFLHESQFPEALVAEVTPEIEDCFMSLINKANESK